MLIHKFPSTMNLKQNGKSQDWMVAAVATTLTVMALTVFTSRFGYLTMTALHMMPKVHQKMNQKLFKLPTR